MSNLEAKLSHKIVRALFFLVVLFTCSESTCVFCNFSKPKNPMSFSCQLADTMKIRVLKLTLMSQLQILRYPPLLLQPQKQKLFLPWRLFAWYVGCCVTNDWLILSFH